MILDLDSINTSLNKLAQKSKRTLIFDDVSPLISDSLVCLFCRFGSEHDYSLILLYHIYNRRPNQIIEQSMSNGESSCDEGALRGEIREKSNLGA